MADPRPIGHVPDAKLIRYRKLKKIADLFDSAGDELGAEFAGDANKAYALSAQYRAQAQELRATTVPAVHDAGVRLFEGKHWP